MTRLNSTGGVAALLGLPANARVVIPHIDDVGMCHGANVAYARLANRGFITSGSVMVPCPWFRELVEICSANPAFDIGVHLTLTSEWRQYRWRPISTTSRTSGLIDGDGYLWRSVAELRANAHPEAVELEMRAQLEAALAAGLDVTHIDAHMAAALSPELLGAYLRLGVEYSLPVLYPRNAQSFLKLFRLGETDLAHYADGLMKLERIGMPTADHFAMTPGVASDDAERAYREMVLDIPPGLTVLALHCNAPGDIETIVPERAHWRIDEYTLFSSEQFVGWVAAQGLTLTGFREIRERWRAARASESVTIN